MPRSARRPNEGHVPVAAARLLRGLLAVLWRERDILSLLGDSLEPQRRVTVSGGNAAAALADDLQVAELERAVLTKSLCRALGDSDYPTLTRLIEISPPAWASILCEHRNALRAGLQRVDTLARRNHLSVVGRDDPLVDECLPPPPTAPPTPGRSLLDFLA